MTGWHPISARHFCTSSARVRSFFAPSPRSQRPRPLPSSALPGPPAPAITMTVAAERARAWSVPAGAARAACGTPPASMRTPLQELQQQSPQQQPALEPQRAPMQALFDEISAAFAAERAAGVSIGMHQPPASSARLDAAVRSAMRAYCAAGHADWRRVAKFCEEHYVRHLVDESQDLEMIVSLTCFAGAATSTQLPFIQPPPTAAADASHATPALPAAAHCVEEGPGQPHPQPRPVALLAHGAGRRRGGAALHQRRHARGRRACAGAAPAGRH